MRASDLHKLLSLVCLQCTIGQSIKRSKVYVSYFKTFIHQDKKKKSYLYAYRWNPKRTEGIRPAGPLLRYPDPRCSHSGSHNMPPSTPHRPTKNTNHGPGHFISCHGVTQGSRPLTLGAIQSTCCREVNIVLLCDNLSFFLLTLTL